MGDGALSFGRSDGLQRRCGIAHAILAPEQLIGAIRASPVRDGDRGHPEHAARVGGVGGGPQRQLDRWVAGGVLRRPGIQARLLRCCQDVLRHSQVMSALEGRAECLQRELAPASGLGGVGGHAYREQENYTAAIHTYEEMAKLGPDAQKRAEMLMIDTYRESHDLDRAIAETKKQLVGQLNRFVRYYNTERPHRGVGRRTPVTAFTAREKAGPIGPKIDAAGYRIRHDRSRRAVW